MTSWFYCLPYRTPSLLILPGPASPRLPLRVISRGLFGSLAIAGFNFASWLAFPSLVLVNAVGLVLIAFLISLPPEAPSPRILVPSSSIDTTYDVDGPCLLVGLPPISTEES